KRAVAPIAQDNHSGSSEIARRSAVALLELLDDLEEPAESPSANLYQPLVEFSRSLLAAQPKMATLFNLVNSALLSINAAAAFGEGKTAVEKCVYNYLAVLVGAAAGIANQITPLIPEGATLLLHSYSGTVNKALIDLKRNGKSFEVI